MPGLAREKCVACRADSPRVTAAEAAEWKPQVPDWRTVEIDGIQRLERTYKFGDFLSALRFTDEVGAAAEAEGHHPKLTTEWGRVGVMWWTHKIRGLHRNDFVMAARTDELFSKASAR